MKLSKFRQRRQDIIERRNEELRALEEQEKKELEKLVKPVVEKIAKVAREEAEKRLSRDPESLEGFSFRKRDAARLIGDALDKFLDGVDEASEGSVPEDKGPQVPNEPAPSPYPGQVFDND